MEGYVIGSKRLTPTIVGKIASKRLFVVVVVVVVVVVLYILSQYFSFLQKDGSLNNPPSDKIFRGLTNTSRGLFLKIL